MQGALFTLGQVIHLDLIGSQLQHIPIRQRGGTLLVLTILVYWIVNVGFCHSSSLIVSPAA